MTVSNKLQRLAALEKRHGPQAAGFRIVVTLVGDPPVPEDYPFPPVPPGRIEVIHWTPNGPNPWEYAPSFAGPGEQELCRDEP
jgi:hypothetical protein